MDSIRRRDNTIRSRRSRGCMTNLRYELDLVLRNNITTKEHPLGVYHPHEELRGVVQEREYRPNRGDGCHKILARLPEGRKLQGASAKRWWMAGTLRGDEVLGKHADWAEELTASYGSFRSDNVEQILRKETGRMPECTSAMRKAVRRSVVSCGHFPQPEAVCSLLRTASLVNERELRGDMCMKPTLESP